MTPHITIIGSGIGGLCAAMQLTRAGYDNFEIIEKSFDIGGTWRDNTYPGCACDVPSHLYSFSFEGRGNWSRVYPSREEIFDYLTELAMKYDLYKRTRFNTEITHAAFNAKTQSWTLTAKSGESWTTDIVIMALGQLNRPKIPKIKGQKNFKGPIFHSAEWEHQHEFENKRIAVIGNGPSAAQFIPELAKIAEQLTIFQRSPAHVVPRKDKPYPSVVKLMFKYIPGLRRAYRGLIYWMLERNFTLFNPTKQVKWIVTLLDKISNANLKSQINTHFDEQVRNKSMKKTLRPNYPIGCKRVIIADDYYPALQKNNVRVETNPIQKITETGIDTKNKTHKFDIIIYGTGFASTDFLAPLKITGSHNTELNEVWKKGASAYLGITMPHFPNFFMIYGPNTNLGHNSIIFMIECQVNYVLSALRTLEKYHAQSLELRNEKMTDFANYLKTRLKSSVWEAECNSWYKNEDGLITNNWPDFTYVYKKETAKLNEQDYIITPTPNRTMAAQ